MEKEIKATIMGQFQHPNVLTLYGVVTQGNPVNNVRSNYMSQTIILTLGYDCVGTNEKRRPQKLPKLSQPRVSRHYP